MVNAVILAAKILIVTQRITSGVTMAAAPTKKTTVKPAEATGNVPAATASTECAVRLHAMLAAWPVAKSTPV